MKIYTKKGDLGTTDLISKRVLKSDLAIHIVGEIDEASARLADCRQHIQLEEARHDLLTVDHYLFMISSMVVDVQDKLKLRIEDEAIKQLEEAIDMMDIKLEPINKFITYDGSNAAIKVSLLRAQVRKIERYLVEYSIQENALKYINRLSDYLFTLMRYLNYSSNIKETTRS